MARVMERDLSNWHSTALSIARVRNSEMGPRAWYRTDSRTGLY